MIRMIEARHLDWATRNRNRNHHNSTAAWNCDGDPARIHAPDRMTCLPHPDHPGMIARHESSSKSIEVAENTKSHMQRRGNASRAIAYILSLSLLLQLLRLEPKWLRIYIYIYILYNIKS